MKRTLWWMILAAMAAAIGGCRGNNAPIVSYSVPKTQQAHAPSATPQTDRTMAAMIPSGKQIWFWKLSGPKEQVGRVAPQFERLLKSLRPATKGSASPPFEWDLPEGWTEQPGDQMRAALFQVDDVPQADISLTVLPLRDVDFDQYVLMNVNRWRRQLSLPEIGTADLAEAVDSDQVGPLQLVRVDMLGQRASGSAAPMASFSPDGLSPHGGSPHTTSPPFASASPHGTQPPTAAAASASSLHYQVPDTWQPGRSGGMRKAAFLVTSGSKQLEITVIDLPPSGMLANVNRWRDQIGLGPISAEQLKEAGEVMTVAGHEARYLELENPDGPTGPEAIYGVILPESGSIDGKIWFIKMRGDLALVQRERDHLRQFVKSLEL